MPRRRLTKQREAFAQRYALNRKPSEAYRRAYPRSKAKPDVIAVEAQKLLNDPKVALRIEELEAIMRAKANEEFAMSAEENIYRLTLIARASLAHYITLDDDGQPTILFNKVTEAEMYGLIDVTVEDIETKRGRGKRVKIKLADRIAALTRLGQQCGMFKQDVQLNTAHPPIPVVLSSAEAAL